MVSDMLKVIMEELEQKIISARKNGKCVVDLEMDKKIIDNQNNGLNDVIAIYFPNYFDKDFFNKVEYKVSEYSENNFRKFNSLEDVAKWIISVYY